MLKQLILYTSLLLCYLVLFFSNGWSTVASETENPFTPKGYVMRYWNKEIRNSLPKPDFLISKASPLTATQSAVFSKLADQNALGTKLPEFCLSAKLLCFPDLSPSLEKHNKDVNFGTYSGKNFTNYGTKHVGGADQFKKYSENENVNMDTFRRYSRDSVGHDDKFTLYSTDTNVVETDFNTYGTGTTGGAGDFSNYSKQSNVPDLKFTSYSADAGGRKQKFTAYAEDGNSGSGTFTSYGKNNKDSPSEFKSYGHSTNVFTSNFNSYSEKSILGNDTFTSYGDDGNNPNANFNSYLDGARAGDTTFTSYRKESNVGDDTFQSYAKNANLGNVNFVNYGKSFNEGTDKFTGYGKGVQGGLTVGFTTYGVNNTFKEYTKNGVKFSQYTNASSGNSASSSKTMSLDGNLVNKWVEPGKFFRESKLKTGVVMPMPDVRDKMPKRSFLPRSISSKLPFASSKLEEMKKIFHAAGNSSMETMMKDAVTECEAAPSAGETKRCVSSMEDMIDFAVSVLGRNVAVRSTENVKGSKGNVLIGSVKGINGGKVTKSVSCHQSLFPYLLYYCHSVPKVRVYEADILDPTTKAKINHGVAICHLDTSAWGKSHGAFLALRSAPGKTEVCHWIFQNDMTWTIAD